MAPDLTSRSPEVHSPHAHAVQFYSDDDFLLEEVVRFLGPGLGAGAAAVIVGTSEHRDGIFQRLKASGINVIAAQQEGRYVSLDAAETLAQFQRDGILQPQRFTETIGKVVSNAAAAVQPPGGESEVLVFGEMVSLLWGWGQCQAAVELERLWNVQAQQQRFSLLCSYPIKFFGQEEHAELFQRVCAEHSAVWPAEGYSAARSEDERLRQVAQLQQKAQALKAAVAERQRINGRSSELQDKNSRLMEEIRNRVRAESRLRQLTGELLAIQDEDRRRMGRELHESTAQVLSALSMMLRALQAESQALTPHAAELLARSGELVRDLLEQVRNLSHLLYPPTLDEQGLRSALYWYVHEFERRTPASVALEIPEDLPRLPRAVENAIFRVVQEYLASLPQQGQGQTATVRIRGSDGEIAIEVQDSRRRTPLEDQTFIVSGGAENVRMGVIRERILQLGGSFKITSSEEGTVLSARLPMVQQYVN